MYRAEFSFAAAATTELLESKFKISMDDITGGVMVLSSRLMEQHEESENFLTGPSTYNPTDSKGTPADKGTPIREKTEFWVEERFKHKSDK